MCSPATVNDAQKQQIAAWSATHQQVSTSPFGKDDQIGMLNLMTASSRSELFARVDPTRQFDLAVDYFNAMPSWTEGGEPTCQISTIRRPRGNVVDDYGNAGREQNELVGSSGEVISMYTHCGTHIDTLCHFGYRGVMWNGFTEHEHLGNRGWLALGSEKHPPLVARGVLLDFPSLHQTNILPPSYGIGSADVQACEQAQNVSVRPGDVVFVRTGRHRVWPDGDAYMDQPPGLNRDGAEYLAKAGAIVIGADTIGLEQGPSDDPTNATPVHTYLLAEAGVLIMEVLNLEELAAESVHEFALIGACLRIKGATGSPIRPIAFPLGAE
jgi:kynurenine formamidase